MFGRKNMVEVVFLSVLNGGDVSYRHASTLFITGDVYITFHGIVL